MEQELRGTMQCPICGFDKPHGHSTDAVAAYHDDQIRADGWISSACKMPKEFGYYLIKDFKFPDGGVRGEYIKRLEQWRRPSFGPAPEVAEYHPSQHYFQLLYAVPLNSRFEPGGLPVFVYPKFWRPIQ